MDTSNGDTGTGNGKPLRLLAYVRVSSKNTAHHEPSEAAQVKAITGWAKAASARIVATYTDRAASGTNGVDGRPELHAALAALHDGEADGLLVQHLDRFSRKLDVQEAVLAQVWDAGAGMYAVQGYGGLVPRDDPDDPMRTAMRQVMGVFTQLERGMIVARMRRGKRAKAARGGYTGGWLPLGLRSQDGEAVPDEAEQAALALIRSQHSEGRSLREIVSALEAGGHRTKRGGRWHPSTVARALARQAGTDLPPLGVQ
jgi:DNA invertase Pin-like site-specific DNA recombinase